MEETVLFGRYRLLEHVGVGGSAQVWRAIDEQTGEEVAIKRLHPIVFANPASRRRLERESRALRTLDHPNIVALRDVRIEDDDAALVLDYVPGRSLAEQLAAQGRLSVAEAVAVTRHVAAALTTAHSAGIIHRDVKPGNIVLAPDGRALLTDFGVAVDGADAGAASAATVLTASGTLVGTFRYMAPEQMRGVPASPGSDQYALAAVTYEMLSGRPPYLATTPVGLAEEQAAEPPAITDLRPELAAVVRRGLARDPTDRFPDVAALAGALEAAAVAAPPGDEPTDLIAVASADDGRRRARAALVPAAALAAVLLGGVLVLGSMSGEPPPPSALDGATATPSPSPEPTPTPTAEPGAKDEKDRDEKDKPGKGKGKDDDRDNSGPGKGDDGDDGDSSGPGSGGGD